MKNLVLLFVSLLVGISSVNAFENTTATAIENNFISEKSFIFVENGITFSVFSDGEFDFYMNDAYSNINVDISFNNGYNYSHFVQYDDYGAVVQIENTPIWYDYYGRVSQIGSIQVFYNANRIRRIGGLYVHYNPYGYYSHCSGTINVYNSYVVYRPFRRFFKRPLRNYCMVRTNAYRQFYKPTRFVYYKPYRNNRRNVYVAIGKSYKKSYYKKGRRNYAQNHYYKKNNKTVAHNGRRGHSKNVKHDYKKSYRKGIVKHSARKKNKPIRDNGRRSNSKQLSYDYKK